MPSPTDALPPFEPGKIGLTPEELRGLPLRQIAKRYADYVYSTEDQNRSDVAAQIAKHLRDLR